MTAQTPDTLPTGLEGNASRGSHRPICQVDVSCKTPFRGGFEVRQGDRIVAQFQTDSAGHFRVHLPPGDYTIQADRSAPLVARSQTYQVTVRPWGFTQLELDLDTGAR
jgi:hypothetical protein